MVEGVELQADFDWDAAEVLESIDEADVVSIIFPHVGKCLDNQRAYLVAAARVAEEAGADLITLHLREDRRHILDSDVEILRERIQSRMNLEIGATSAMIDIACQSFLEFISDSRSC